MATSRSKALSTMKATRTSRACALMASRERFRLRTTCRLLSNEVKPRSRGSRIAFGAYNAGGFRIGGRKSIFKERDDESSRPQFAVKQFSKDEPAEFSCRNGCERGRAAEQSAGLGGGRSSHREGRRPALHRPRPDEGRLRGQHRQG